MKKEEEQNVKGINRRDILKSLAGIPILGLFGYSVIRNMNYQDQDQDKRKILKELGLEEFSEPVSAIKAKGKNRDLLRIGIVGFGNRAKDLAKGLGFLHPDETDRRATNGTLGLWLEQEDLNVAITGICDVFDRHAEFGLATALNNIGPGGVNSRNLPVKRFTHYHEMLQDDEIDAVVIATPDFHHARMAIDAVKAGKHVYCEKSVALKEEELHELYHVVTRSDRVFQLGHQVPQNVVFQQAQKVIQKGLLGKISMIETTSNRNSERGAWVRHLDEKGNPKPGNEMSIDWLQWLGDAPFEPFSIERYYNWTLWHEYGMGLISQLFTHEYDAINQLLRIGIPSSAMSSGGNYYWKDGRDMADILDCVFNYPDHELILKYSGNLANGRQRGRVIMGHDASMELGSSMEITVDPSSTRFGEEIRSGLINTSAPLISVGSGKDVDGVSSATASYYASRGLISTNIDGKNVDLTHLHIREWIDCIHEGGTPSANIERAFEEGITCLMAHRSYVEKRKVEWDPVKRRIV